MMEVLSVVIIIGVLVAISVPIYNSTQQTARNRVDEANIRNLKGVVNQWISKNPNTSFPNDEAAWQTELVPNYLQAWPVSPTSGRTYKWNTIGKSWEMDPPI